VFRPIFGLDPPVSIHPDAFLRLLLRPEQLLTDRDGSSASEACRRFIAWKNHDIATRIVSEAAAGGFGLSEWRIRGIRERTLTWNPHLNRMMSGWSFGQLQEFVLYKGERAGIGTEKVDPWRTSQTCHKCRRPGIRKGEEFFCTTCGRIDADWNASCVIAAGGVEPGDIPGDRNATRIAAEIVEFFSRPLHAKAAGL
jgi:IS605 OrfB family transposase